MAWLSNKTPARGVRVPVAAVVRPQFNVYYFARGAAGVPAKLEAKRHFLGWLEKNTEEPLRSLLRLHGEKDGVYLKTVRPMDKQVDDPLISFARNNCWDDRTDNRIQMANLVLVIEST